MATVFSQNVTEIAVDAVCAGRPHVNVWHMFGGEGSATGDQDLVQDFANNWQEHIIPELTIHYVVNAFRWRSLDPDDQNTGTIIPDPAKPVQGPSQLAIAPVNVAFLMHKNTANRPRGARDGRMFISDVAEGRVTDGGLVEPAAAGAWATALNLFFDGISDKGVAPGDIDGSPVRYPVVLQSTPLSRAPGAQPVTVLSREVTSVTLDPMVATQRDRLR